jgi:hypothetical protein
MGKVQSSNVGQSRQRSFSTLLDWFVLATRKGQRTRARSQRHSKLQRNNVSMSGKKRGTDTGRRKPHAHVASSQGPDSANYLLGAHDSFHAISAISRQETNSQSSRGSSERFAGQRKPGLCPPCGVPAQCLSGTIVGEACGSQYLICILYARSRAVVMGITVNALDRENYARAHLRNFLLQVVDTNLATAWHQLLLWFSLGRVWRVDIKSPALASGA